ncbi:hypothetical protein AMTR_s00097p00130500 [Amborella trichopoda]|uniref:Uncharacterized protein n=1 Tax=Amborella trichopoda TaxID=13333 RepID=W1P299_AMBTC|nr:hypothetical protein AMTR_s00097p00130500 [Amborella trichopoda]
MVEIVAMTAGCWRAVVVRVEKGRQEWEEGCSRQLPPGEWGQRVRGIGKKEGLVEGGGYWRVRRIGKKEGLVEGGGYWREKAVNERVKSESVGELVEQG